MNNYLHIALYSIILVKYIFVKRKEIIKQI